MLELYQEQIRPMWLQAPPCSQPVPHACGAPPATVLQWCNLCSLCRACADQHLTQRAGFMLYSPGSFAAA
jgi:hypothetical protein